MAKKKPAAKGYGKSKVGNVISGKKKGKRVC